MSTASNLTAERLTATRLTTLYLTIVVFVIWGCAITTPTTSAPLRQKPGQPKPYKVFGKWYQPLADARGFRQRGIASWYGKDFHGKKTSNGETYNMYAMTAAHKTLPLGTHVRVHNLENGRKVDVRVNDRGPFVRGRIIDLSYTAANKIGIVGPGTAKVEIFARGTPTTTDGGGSSSYAQTDFNTGNFTFQVGAFVNRENAERLKNDLAKSYKNAHITVYDRGDKVFYRVRVGRFTTLDQAARQEDILIQDGFPDAFVVAE
jgi:rare lipoprotein A